MWYDEYKQLIDEGFSQRKAAKKLGIPRSTIQSWLAVKRENEDNKIDLDEDVVDFILTNHAANVVKDDNKDTIERLKAAEYLLKKVEIQGFNQGAVSTIDRSQQFEHTNQCILLISDMHIPYHHKNTLEFLAYLKAKYKPTRVICLGDELDGNSLSYHEKTPELPSAMDEISLALPVIAKLHKLFPTMDILDSNHGSLIYRKAKTHGIPKHYIKSYNDVLGVDDGWKWHMDITLKLPTGNTLYLHHGKASRGLTMSEKMGCCTAQGHFHNSFSIEYYSTPMALNWALQCGCLIDFKSLAFSYSNVNIKRPVIGTGLVIDGQPLLVPMLLDDNAVWIKPSDYNEVMGFQQ